MTQTRAAQPNPGVSRKPIVPCLWFDDQAEQAARFYTEIFPSGRVTGRSYYPASGDNPTGKPPGSVLTVELEIAGQRFTALNGGPLFTINPTISFFVHVDTAREAESLFEKLVGGGAVLMALGEYPWSKCYGWVKDRFGVSWQVMAGPRASGVSTIAPCLMFAGQRHGQAEAALQTYARILRDARVELIERHAASEGPEGTVKHGRVAIGDQTLIAMDSHIDHGVTFNDAISLQIMCDDQAEVDRYWSALTDGGEEGPCGWLKDRFGVSWQVVPSRIAEWMTSTDIAARDRAFQAVMGMRKLDIAAIQAAFEGKPA